MSGLNMMMEKMMQQALASLPPELIENISNIGKIAVDAKRQLDRIEMRQRLIMDALKIHDTSEMEIPNDGS